MWAEPGNEAICVCAGGVLTGGEYNIVMLTKCVFTTDTLRQSLTLQRRKRKREGRNDSMGARDRSKYSTCEYISLSL